MEAPPVITPARPRFPWLIACGVALIGLAGAAVYFFFDPSHYNFYPSCALYTLTGLECPGCGSQRAVYHLLHGHLTAALRCNALFVLGLPVFAVLLARFASRWMATGVVPTVNLPVRWVMFAVGVILLFGVLRNIPVAPFIYLAPP